MSNFISECKTLAIILAVNLVIAFCTFASVIAGAEFASYTYPSSWGVNIGLLIGVIGSLIAYRIFSPIIDYVD